MKHVIAPYSSHCGLTAFQLRRRSVRPLRLYSPSGTTAHVVFHVEVGEAFLSVLERPGAD